MHGIFPQRPLACALSRLAAIEPVRGGLLSYFVIAHAGHGFAGLAVNRIPPSYRVANNGRRLNSCRLSACREQPSSLVNSASFSPHSCQLVRINTRPAPVCRARELQASPRPTLSERALRPASSTQRQLLTLLTNHLHNYSSLRPRHVLLFSRHLKPGTRLLLR